MVAEESKRKTFSDNRSKNNQNVDLAKKLNHIKKIVADTGDQAF